MSTTATKAQLSHEKILESFQQLRNEQANLAHSLNALEMDLREHKAVIETLNSADPDRKCFRLIGGVLCERTVKDVLPQLVENMELISKTITTVTEDLSKKGVELNKFKVEHKIKICGEHTSTDDNKKNITTSGNKAENRNVLVSD